MPSFSRFAQLDSLSGLCYIETTIANLSVQNRVNHKGGCRILTFRIIGTLFDKVSAMTQEIGNARDSQ